MSSVGVGEVTAERLRRSVNVLLFGISHRSAPVSVLEQLSTGSSGQAKIAKQSCSHRG